MMNTVTATLVNLVDRPLYAMSQVERILNLRGGTARRWIDGYTRGRKEYPPVIREKRTGDETVTWGEFVETRLLSEYRSAGVPLIRMRPAIEVLRAELNTSYPLASARTWLDVEGRELVARVQEQVGLDKQLALVVVRTGQRMITEWTRPADDFRRSVEWQEDEPLRVRPVHDIEQVHIDPLRGFGEPTVRSVRTEIIAELVRAGDTPEMIAELYDLNRRDVNAAVRYELLRAAA